MQSVLHNASREMVETYPFPHIIVPNALDEDVYRQLARDFPPNEVLIDGRPEVNNDYLHYSAASILSDARISPSWVEFTAYHTSNAFFREVINLFGDHIRRLNPHLERQLNRRAEDWQTGTRFRDELRDAALECQFTYCAAVTSPSRSIGPHVDREVALYAGLLYFRLDDDDSTGGDLEFYEFRTERREYDDERKVADDLVRAVKTIEYRSNTLVFFLHSPDSVHGVTERSVTEVPRLHVNFVGELKEKVFDLSPYRKRARSGIA